MDSSRTRVKICGITRLADVEAAVAAGADALGFVFVPASRRSIRVETARDLVARVPAFVQTVALFADPSVDWVETVIDQVGPDLLQFHGSETGRFCRQFGRPYIKAVSADLDDEARRRIMQEHHTARGFLIDSHAVSGLGGTGHTFDWSRWPRDSGRDRRPWILAGGLSPDNVTDAINTLSPYAVDVSSGVEETPGIKSADKIHAFMRGVGHARNQR
ncbi:phosphoribosylanthranilate isomerase [Guyparkeria sp. SCN-R1]|uniref:phosphoribosylanthranilate isomerase n=1 Tax=Guyparkeria sp. SCN-R1 TaxID=2341113 RepID=UPI000F65507B|nr:phosphoribosylanthranilate isomerase [Guyparkeria sp. SCN-R1]RRQ23993.1 phosphoribosylanthranilate isomerase [Guyparkeria sp. SCN-R1]